MEEEEGMVEGARMVSHWNNNEQNPTCNGQDIRGSTLLEAPIAFAFEELLGNSEA